MDKRSKEFKDLNSLAPTTQELLSEQIDGEVYTYVKSHQCKVCSSDEEVLRLIDTLLLFPKGYKDTLRETRLLEERLDIPEERRVSYDSIRNHYHNHLPLDKKSVRDIVERRAQLKGKKVLDTGGHILTPEAFFEVIVAKGFEDIVSGLNRPTISQTIQAVNMLKRLEEETDKNYKPEVLINQLNIIVMAIREVLPPDMREAVFQKIDEYSRSAKEALSVQELNEAQEYIDDDLEYGD